MRKENSFGLLEGESTRKAVIRFSLPAMGAMVMVLAYNLADLFFIGQTHDPLQVAAISVATPVFLLFMAAGSMFGIGGASVISRALGAGRQDHARKVCSFCMWGCVIVGVAMSAMFLCFMDQLLSLVGASGDTTEYAREYLVIASISGPCVLVSTCFSNVVRAEGHSVEAMLGSVLGNVVNIVLDPVLILACGWEVAGAAWATVAGNVAGALYYVWYYKSGRSSLSVSMRLLTVREDVAKDVLAIGVPSALTQVLMSVSTILLNAQMVRYGDMAVAGVGVASKVTMITGTLCIGLGQGTQPLLGYCVGSGDWKKYRSVFRFAMLFALGVGSALAILCQALAPQIAGAFLADASALGYAESFSRIMLSTSWLFGLFYVLTGALQACGAAVDSLIVSLSRQGLIYVPALYILGAMFQETGLVWAQPVADALSLVLAWILYVRMSRRLMRGDDKGVLPLEAAAGSPATEHGA